MKAVGRSEPWLEDQGHSGYAALAVRNGVRSNGGPSRRIHPIVEVIGERFVMQNVQHLQGVRDGGQYQIGTCRHQGRPVVFQWWFPHVGIAVDVVAPNGSEAEVDTKRAWCIEKEVLYFGPTDAMDTDMLRELAAERRAA